MAFQTDLIFLLSRPVSCSGIVVCCHSREILGHICGTFMRMFFLALIAGVLCTSPSLFAGSFSVQFCSHHAASRWC
ncbi:hypothetical protein LY76DRAFT_42306 [Colletotrichum caudatum]|nr:hypothetical protein LY76DRAFT_42306 [Colletotrichum caudatum]